jgi:xylulose-5-phosphate/fructose-6-phosphate phosphoketolase
LSEHGFDALFTRTRPVVFAYHGYPYLIHRLTYKRANHVNIHVHGFQEEGATTTPFDMVVINVLDRYHLAIDAIERWACQSDAALEAKRMFSAKLEEHRRYICEHGEDMPEILEWKWPCGSAS